MAIAYLCKYINFAEVLGNSVFLLDMKKTLQLYLLKEIW